MHNMRCLSPSVRPLESHVTNFSNSGTVHVAPDTAWYQKVRLVERDLNNRPWQFLPVPIARTSWGTF